MSDVVVAIHTAQVATGGLPVVIVEGSFWRADDPLVLAYPASFSSDLGPYLNESKNFDPAAAWGDVESATAEPGEKRTVRRPSKSEG